MPKMLYSIGPQCLKGPWQGFPGSVAPKMTHPETFASKVQPCTPFWSAVCSGIVFKQLFLNSN